MSTWGKMLFFNSEEEQILGGLEKGKVKKNPEKKSVRTAVKQTNKQANE